MCENTCMGRFKVNRDGGNKLKEIVIIVGVILLSMFDIFIIKRKEIIDDDKKIHIREILPIGWKQALYCIAIPVSMFAVVYMLDLFYQSGFFFIVKRLALVTIMWPIAITDYRELRIPNKLILTGILLRVIILVMELFFEWDTLQTTVISEGIATIGAAVICIICMLISKGSLGMGDLKLMMLMGLMLGVEGICYAMFLSIFFSFAAAVILLVMRKKKKNDAIPFAPFILAGTVTAMILSGV